MEQLDIIAVALTAIAILITRLYLAKTRQLTLPPGPTPRWWYGNVHQLPKIHPWETYAKWSETYGPVVLIRIFRKKTIILNTGKAVLDLLESRSAIYSDRPETSPFNTLIGSGLSVFSISSHHPRFKIYRKLLHSGLNPRAVRTYRPIQEQETRTFLQGLLNSPQNFVSHIRRNAGALILNVTFGYTVSEDEDRFVKLIEDAIRFGGAARQKGPFLVDALPILRYIPDWFPGAGFKRLAQQIRSKVAGIRNIPFLWAKSQIKTGNYVESFVSKHVHPEDEVIDEEQEDIIVSCSTALYAGGADTTVSAMTSFFFLMSAHPEVQKRAQSEIDAIVGKGRLPTLDDRESLVYVAAVVKEVLRWGPVAPLGLQHRVTEDDTYEGHLIPKGATVIANIWAILHDSEMYPDPSVFDPNRHLGPTPQVNPLRFVFGFGRRACPGAHLAELSLFLNISNTLAAFNITKEIDATGKEIEPKVDFSTGGAITHLCNFGCCITPRSAEMVALLSV